MNLFEEEIIKALKKTTKSKEINLEVPPSADLGDFAFPCFELAKKEKRNPNEIAQDLKDKLKLSENIEQIVVEGPYLNFFVNKETIAESTIKKILKEKEDYGKGKQGKTVVIESPGPNTNKPLHLGHLRNMALGISLSNIFAKLGNKVINVDIVNDRGVHICKSMLAYQKYGKNKKPNKKSDHFVGDFYVMYNKKLSDKEDEIKDLLKKWEDGDKETLLLWGKMNKWALDGFKETYKRFGVKMDKPYFESDHYRKGKDVVEEGVKKGIFYDEDGAIAVDLEKENLGKKVLIRSDGTSVYVTQDMGLAVHRYKDWKMDKMIYVVGSEQIYHFKVLFEVLKKLNYKFVKNYYHLAYGMVNLPEGKMKSREGTVVDADDFMDEAVELAKKEILKRHKISKKELEKRAEMIGLGAIKFFILKYDPLKDFTYNPEESIAFEGETGPYVQYAHTRISSILDKTKLPAKVDYSLLEEDEEKALMTLLAKYPKVIEDAAQHYKPSFVANYLLKLAQAFNSFYNKHPVLKAEKELKNARLHLISAVRHVLKEGLSLLGIEAPKRM